MFGRAIACGLALACATATLVYPALVDPVQAQTSPLRLLNEYSFESGRDYEGTTVGGLSGLVYDAGRGVYYAICDDRGEKQPPRFYTLRISLGAGGISDVAVVGVTTLDSDAATPGVQPYETNDSDLEDIQLLDGNRLLISSERDRNGKGWIREFAVDGTLLGELPLPSRFETTTEPGPDGRPRVVRGFRSNLGIEGMTLTPDGNALYTANEEALAQDGPIATLTNGTNVRVTRWLRGTGRWQAGVEHVYEVDKIFAQPQPADQFADNGVTSLLWVKHLLPAYDMLVLERSFSTGVGNDVNVYGVTLADAADVSGLDALPAPYTGRVVRKTLLANMGALGIKADNLEGLAFGPRLPNGKPSVIVMSDDNFSSFDPPQLNQFVAFELDVPAQAAPAPASPAPAPIQIPSAR